MKDTDFKNVTKVLESVGMRFFEAEYHRSAVDVDNFENYIAIDDDAKKSLALDLAEALLEDGYIVIHKSPDLTRYLAQVVAIKPELVNKIIYSKHMEAKKKDAPQ